MRRGSIIQLTAIGLVAGAICTAVALAIPWLPVAGGEEAGRIHFVYWFTTVIAICVFSVVTAVLVYSVWKFRAGPDDDSDGPPTHGHTQLEIVWTAIPAVLVTAISIVSAIVLAQNGHAGTNPLVIKVEARQFAWKFTYPNGKSYGYLTLPQGRHVKLDITADDVIHSFWVPQLSQKQDAVPGQHNSLVITPTHIATYPVVCTELCGLGHALMRSHVDILSAADYAKWVDAWRGRPHRAARARGLPAERLRRLSHVQAGARDRDRRPRPRQPRAGGRAGTPWRPRRVHRGVDRQAGGLYRAGLHGRDAAHLRHADPARQVEAARAVSGEGSLEP